MVDPPNNGPWHTWFAWHPVNTTWHGWKWLTTVVRRKWYGGGTHGWNYRALEDTPSCDKRDSYDTHDHQPPRH